VALFATLGYGFCSASAKRKPRPSAVGRGALSEGQNGYGFTTCFTAVEVLPAKVESPPYTAVTESVPTGRADVAKVADPPLNGPVPSTFAPFLNETVSPLGGAPT